MWRRWLKLKKLNNLEFYLVTYSNISRNGIISDVKNAIDAGCKIVQYREKNKTTKDMISEAKRLKELCYSKSVFLINDHIDVALAVDADGVHLGQDDIAAYEARKILGPDKVIGLTVHNEDEAIKAEQSGADYLGVAPIFSTDTKEDSGVPCGVEMINKIRHITNLPIVAVGGINKTNVANVISNGADGVVAVSAVLDSKDVYNNIKEFIDLVKEAKKL